jgi:hypothetical protein
MPKLLRYVVAVMIFSVGVQIVWIVVMSGWTPFVAATPTTRSIIPPVLGILVTIGILRGYAVRSRIAWHIGRIWSLIGMIVAVVILVSFLSPRVSFNSRLIPMSMFLNAATACFMFVSLGHQSVKAYFAPKKETEALESTTR